MTYVPSTFLLSQLEDAEKQIEYYTHLRNKLIAIISTQKRGEEVGTNGTKTNRADIATAGARNEGGGEGSRVGEGAAKAIREVSPAVE